jgi:hypothetical protein
MSGRDVLDVKVKPEQSHEATGPVAVTSWPARSEVREAVRAAEDRVPYAIYATAVAAAISVWFLALRAPLWLDETSSFWQISKGFRQILPRRGQVSAAYPYILWLFTRITGTSEVGLRIASLVAMLSAVYLLYRAAEKLFGREIACVTAAVFCVHPLIIFSSIDARPYAFGALAINASIWLLVRLRTSDSVWLAAAFGVCAGLIVHFHLLFGTVLPILALCLFLMKAPEPKVMWRQLGIATGACVVVALPVVGDFLAILRGRQMYVFEKSTASLEDLGWTVAPGWFVYIFAGVVLISAATRRINLTEQVELWRVVLCAAVGLAPLLILYGVTVATPTNVFIDRYRLVAIPGIALAWGMIVSRVELKWLRVAFCVVLVGATCYQYYRSPFSRLHKYTWKYALELAERNASVDSAPVLICSDFPSSDYFPMPQGEAVKDSAMFTPLSYYRLSVPVVGLPRALNANARQDASEFLVNATARKQRFLAMGWEPSYNTLHWILDMASQAYEVRVLGQPDGVVVLEFDPRVTE